jgi:DNA-directed RNA polymerase specialized sigma24 family protein
MMATPAEQDLEAIFREHYRLVYKTACVVTGSPRDAEDVLQTIFLRLIGNHVVRNLKPTYPNLPNNRH